MSTDEINSLKEEIYSSLKQLEQKVFDTINVKTAQLTDNYNNYNEKLDSILTHNKELIESIVSEKINVEKINTLESFKNKADGMLISHEIRINNHNKDIDYMKEKYDRAIEDNLLIPGLIGPKCQFQNVKEYINANNSDIARLKYEKDQLKLDTKDFKIKFDNLFKQMISLVDSSVDRSKDYTNTRISETKNFFDRKVEEFNGRADDLRAAISQTKTDIEAQVNYLKLETEKIKNFLEKTKILEQSIDKINNDVMKVNYEINKLYEKDNNANKKISELKNDLSKVKVMSDIKNKSRNLQNSVRIREPMESYTNESVRKEEIMHKTYREKTLSEKKETKNLKKKQYTMRNQKIDFNKKEENKSENKTKNKENKENKAIKEKEKEKKLKLNMLINKHMMNKIQNDNGIDDEEKSETIISEESLLNNNYKEPNYTLNKNDFTKTIDIDSRLNLKNEDIINVNHNFKEAINREGFTIENNIIPNSPKPTQLIQRRVSEIKFDLKTKSLKKKIYTITSENTFFPKINQTPKPNLIIDKNQKLMISDIQTMHRPTNNTKRNENENDKNISISSESNDNNIDSINSKLAKQKANQEKNVKNLKNDIKQKITTNNKNNIEQKESSKTISRLGSIKSLNDNGKKMSNLPSYRSSKKIEINSEPIYINKKNKNEQSPKYFEENKYLLPNFKKNRKKLNLSQVTDKKINTNINSNFFNNENLYINKMYNSPIESSSGINLVGLNDDAFGRKDSVDGDLFFEPNMQQNLKLERLGIPSPNNSQPPKKKKIKLQGISTEAPLKISAAFGRTMYTFIDKNNTKNIYSIKTIKKKPENEKLDIYLGSNNFNK